MLRAVLASTLLALACRSSTRHTLPAAVVNTALAVGFSAADRAAGGCYSPCNPGYACNPVTGFCERDAPICVGESNDPRCPPRIDVPIGTQQQGAGSAPSPAPVGLSPDTGRAPPLPGERPPPGR